MIGRLICNNIARTSAMPRVVTAIAAIGSTRSMAVGGDFASKEKLEEERYIRAREAELREAKAKADAASAKAKELEAKSADLLATKTAAMTEVANMLAQTGDVISEAGLANLADWKHGV